MISGRVERTNMLRLAGIAYLTLNFLLVGAEARWHILYRLTMWDAAELKTFVSLISRHH